jgi:hypothetical protein
MKTPKNKIRYSVAKHWFAAVGIFLCPTLAFAHEGHGDPGQGDSVTHYLLTPFHLTLSILLCIAITLAARMMGRQLSRKAATRCEQSH